MPLSAYKVVFLKRRELTLVFPLFGPEQNQTLHWGKTAWTDTVQNGHRSQRIKKDTQGPVNRNSVAEGN